VIWALAVGNAMALTVSTATSQRQVREHMTVRLLVGGWRRSDPEIPRLTLARSGHRVKAGGRSRANPQREDRVP
jgi:hypothetical protein